ncbi:MAG: Protein YceI [Owenweeksia sp. TMED14]|nr:MAG: Protein YceI [Owenweeksia sp. TMED14]
MRIINSLSIILLLNSFIISAQENKLDIQNSNLKWTGTKITNSSHYGSINFKSGTIVFSEGLIESGEFIVDMTSINVEDIQDGGKEKLEGHLRSDDFFSVEKFNFASLVINSSVKTKQGLKVFGDLNIKGISSPVEFDMKKNAAGWATYLTFDRSKYNVRYGSGSFFDNLGDKLILDEIELEGILSFK